MNLSTDQKGAIAELAIAWEAAQLGIGVYKPLTDGERYDLIFDLGPQIGPSPVQVGDPEGRGRERAMPEL